MRVEGKERKAVELRTTSSEDELELEDFVLMPKIWTFLEHITNSFALQALAGDTQNSPIQTG